MPNTRNYQILTRHYCIFCNVKKKKTKNIIILQKQVFSTIKGGVIAFVLLFYIYKTQNCDKNYLQNILKAKVFVLDCQKLELSFQHKNRLNQRFRRLSLICIV
jgi:phosphate/sulfate permease